MHLQQKRTAVLALAVASIVGSVRAEWINSTWTGQDGQNDVYTDPANWAGGLIDHVFSGNILAGASRTIQLPDTQYIIPASGMVFTYEAPNNNQALTLLPDSESSRTLTLNGNILVDVGQPNQGRTVNFGSSARAVNLDLNGGVRTITITPSGLTQWVNFDTLNIYGDITNGKLIKDGWGNLQLNNAVTLDSPIDFRHGTITLANNGSIASGINIRGLWSRVVVTAQPDGDRLGDSGQIVFNHGALIFRNPVANSTATETLGPVVLASGKAYLGMEREVNATSTTTIYLSEFTRYNSASIAIGGNYLLGITNKILVTSDAGNDLITGSLVGGGGAAGTTNISILPWATYSIPNSGSQDSNWYGAGTHGSGEARVGGFVTYDPVNGFRPLNTTTEYAQGFELAGPTDNVRLTDASNFSLASNKTVNSIFLDSPSAVPSLDLGGNTLTVTSGAITTADRSWTITNGTLNFGDNPGVFSGRSSHTISAVITGNAGVVLDNVGSGVFFTAANAYTGDTIIHGTLQTQGGADRIPDSSHVQISLSGTLVLGDGTARNEVIASLGGSGLLRWGSNTTRSSLRLGEGLDVIPGAVVVGTFLAPGDPEGPTQTGTLTLGTATTAQVDVVFQPGSTYKVDLLSADDYDSLALAKGAAVINGGTLELNFLGGYIPAAGDGFRLITTTLGTTGTFSTINSNLPGITFTQQIDGNDLVLTVVPEPSIAGLLAATTGMALARRRRS